MAATSDWHRFRFRSERHASDALLELAILGRVDEGVDAAVGEHQDDGEVVEPAAEVHAATGEADEDQDLLVNTSTMVTW